MSTPPHPSKSDFPPLRSPSERRDGATTREGESVSPEGITHPTSPSLLPVGEPLTLDEAMQLHRAALQGGDVLPLRLSDAMRSSGLPLIGRLPVSPQGAVPSQGAGRNDDLRDPATAGRRPPAVGPTSAQILEEARRIVDEVDSALLRDRPRVARGGGRGRSSSPSSSSSSSSSNTSNPSVPRSSGRLRHPEQDRQ